MFQKYTFQSLFISAILLCMVGCTKDSIEEIGNKLFDTELTNLLLDNSKTGSLNYYIQPQEYDFSAIPQDANNPLNTSKVTLGKLLFHETGIALNPHLPQAKGTYSCASCHNAKAGFQAARAQGIGDGGIGFGIAGENRQIMLGYDETNCDVQPIRTPSTLNVAYQANLLWSGKLGAGTTNLGYENMFTEEGTTEINNLGFEGTETQAIVGLGVHRMEINDFLAAYEEYNKLFSEAFNDETEPITKENAGLAIAAYERTLLPNKAPFQEWLKGNEAAMTEQQKQGAIIFFGKGNCVNCHTGPALNSMDYYAYGMNDLINQGEVQALPSHLAHKGRGGFTGLQTDMFKFKVPQLYNLADSKFYGHGASFRTIKSIVEYKNKGIPENSRVMQSLLSPEFEPLNLSNDEIDKLVDFIANALYDADLERYVPESLPTGNCFPNNDEQSQIDLGCN